jgi:hypothetical protein
MHALIVCENPVLSISADGWRGFITPACRLCQIDVPTAKIVSIITCVPRENSSGQA